ncbi:MAG: response regulator transcription factor [Actinomycetota bacterium]
MIRLAIVDDQALIRAGLARILSPADGFDLVAEASDGAEGVRLAADHALDVVLMDIRMRGMDGIEATRAIRGADGPPVLILTTFDDDETLADAIDAGAAGFALKESPAEDLIRAVQVVASGGSWIDPLVTPRVLASFRAASPAADPPTDVEELTERENEVLRLMAVGATNTEIAEDLDVGEATVKTHVGNIFAKLAVRDRVGAIIWAYDHGLAQPDPPAG